MGRADYYLFLIFLIFYYYYYGYFIMEITSEGVRMNDFLIHSLDVGRIIKLSDYVKYLL